MGKKKITIKREKLDFSYSPSAFKRIRPYQSHEIEPVLSRLFGRNMAERPSLSEPERYDGYVNELVTNYILIRNVSAVEYYLRQIASMIVDNNGADFSKFFSEDFETKFKAVNQGRGRGRKKLTRGQFFASLFNFAKPDEINWVFSRLLDLKFFDTIKKINRYASKNPWPGSRGIVRNWKNFMKMFEWRNQIVHSMELEQLSREELRSLCSNTLVFMELARIVVDPPTGLGSNAEQDNFYRIIIEQRRLHSQEQQRTGKPSKNNLQPISTTVDDSVILH